MKKFLYTFLLLFFSFFSYAQGGWFWNQLPDMPFKTSNNAVSSIKIGDTTFVYSFLGIDTTKQWNGIHTKAARYNTVSQIWDTLPNVPDSLGGLIAASTSVINNKIIIIGGYHVYNSGIEISSKHTHIYDPISNTYTRGANIPIEIDDHVQLTYKDSLIYVITGWTSSLGGGNNTNAVQIYDAINDVWSIGTSVPNSSLYKVFGASGTIINDTIYYAGGARVASNFPLVYLLRKGVIDENDPLTIAWSSDTVINNFKPYRSACVTIENKAFWIGGSSVSYNYDALAYSNNSGVNPNNFITEYNNSTNKWKQYSSTPFQIMDMRGIAIINDNQFIISGGMLQNQEVTNNVFELSYDTSFLSATDSVDVIKDTLTLISKKIKSLIIEKSSYIYRIKNKHVAKIELVDLFGRTVKHVFGNEINTLGVQGIFFLQVTFEEGLLLKKKILVN